MIFLCFFFFFQAEDGIRDGHVTGVQTCALPISLGIRKADFLSTNNDFGLGAAKEFSEMLKAQGVQVGVMETMDPKATDFSAQLAKIKASGGDTLFVTTAVEQITLILKQA